MKYTTSLASTVKERHCKLFPIPMLFNGNGEKLEKDKILCRSE